MSVEDAASAAGPPEIHRPGADSVREGYDRWAAVYDHDANPLPALEDPVLRDAVGAVRGLDALDLGCGTGRHTAWLAGAGARVTAVDFSERMLAEAHRKIGDVDGATAPTRFVVHDLAAPLPFPDASFDVVVSGLVLEHLGNPAAFFAEAHRVLRARGRAVFSTLHPYMFLRGSQAKFVDPDSGDAVRPGSHPHGTSEFVRGLLGAGFRLEGLDEIAADAAFAARYPRAERHIGWPMLLVLRARSGRDPSGAERRR